MNVMTVVILIHNGQSWMIEIITCNHNMEVVAKKSIKGYCSLTIVLQPLHLISSGADST